MLFVTFLLSGIVLFLVIYAYSVLQLNKHNVAHDAVAESAGIKKPKITFLDKLKRKDDSPDDAVEVEDSSTTVGGVTAKVASSIIDSVKPAKDDRVAPTLSEAAESNESIDIVDAKIDIRNAPQNIEQENLDLEKIQVEKVAVAKVAVAKVSTPAVIETKGVTTSSSSTSKPVVSTSELNDASIEALAVEFATKQESVVKVTPDEISRALSEQGQLHNNESIPHVTEDTRQDLLTGQREYEEAKLEPELQPSLVHDDVKDKSKGVPEARSRRNIAEAVQKTHAPQKELKAQPQKPQQPSPKKEFKAGANAIEIVAKISSVDNVLRDKILTIYRRYDYLFTRHIGVYGKNSLTHVWGDIEQSGPEDQFDDIAVSLQLADRTGAMTRKESNTFSTLAVEMADELNKKMEFSMDVDESVEKGRMLDELARKYDAMVVCNIIPKRRKGFRSTDIKSCTKDLQMLPAKNGVFGRFAKVGKLNSLRYSLALADAEGEYIPASTRDPFQVDEIVVFMNVPLVKNPTEAFDSMIRDARKLAAWMDGKIVDKNARNMTSRTLDKIAEQISIIQKEMSLDGLTPGSELCKKLF